MFIVCIVTVPRLWGPLESRDGRNVPAGRQPFSFHRRRRYKRPTVDRQLEAIVFKHRRI